MQEQEILPNGAKQSRLNVRYDLIRFDALSLLFSGGCDSDIEKAIFFLHQVPDANNMERINLLKSVFHTLQHLYYGDNKVIGIKTSVLNALAGVLDEGAKKYGENNWLSIPTLSHVNHALNHLYLLRTGDTSERHREHATTRVFMALTIEERERKNAQVQVRGESLHKSTT